MEEVQNNEVSEPQINETPGETEVMASPPEETISAEPASNEIEPTASVDIDGVADSGDVVEYGGDAAVGDVLEAPGSYVSTDQVGEDHVAEPNGDLSGGDATEENGADEGANEEVAGDNDPIDGNGESVEPEDDDFDVHDVDVDELIANEGGAQGHSDTFVDEPLPGSKHLRPVDLEAGLNSNQKEQARGAFAENGRADENEEDKPLVEKEVEEKKKEINHKFKDVQETGNWGEISSTETYGVVFCVIVAVIVLVIVILALSGDSDSVDEVDIPKLTSAPTPTPSLPSPEAKLKAIARVWGEETLFQPLLEELPSSADAYVDQQQNKDASERERAISWLLYEDPLEDLEQIGTRYALATLYYSFGGDSWSNNTNWLTDAESCDWYGVKCDTFRTFVQEIDLSTNNMNGTVPNEIALFPDVQVLALRENDLYGSLPAEALGTLTTLFILYLQDNMFTGPIPDNLYAAETLAVFFIQGNAFEGDFPSVYCDQNQPVFREFGLDCEPNPCAGCCTELNCYDD